MDYANRQACCPETTLRRLVRLRPGRWESPAVAPDRYWAFVRSWLYNELQKGDEAAILAGGMTLGPMLNLRVVRPRAVIDISRIEALKTISVTSKVVVTGAGVIQNHALSSYTARRVMCAE